MNAKILMAAGSIDAQKRAAFMAAVAREAYTRGEFLTSVSYQRESASYYELADNYREALHAKR